MLIWSENVLNAQYMTIVLLLLLEKNAIVIDAHSAPLPTKQLAAMLPLSALQEESVLNVKLMMIVN